MAILDELKMVFFDRGQRPVSVFDLERITVSGLVGKVHKEKNTFKVTPAEPTTVQSAGPGRWDGEWAGGQRHGNAQVGARWRISGDTAQEALDNVEEFLTVVRSAQFGRYIKWRPSTASYPTYYEVRGPGSWTPDYSKIIFEQNFSIMVDATWPVAPLAQMDRMDICDTFDVPDDAAVLVTNLVGDPSAVSAANFSIYQNAGPTGWTAAASTAQSMFGGQSVLVAGGTAAATGQIGVSTNGAGYASVVPGRTYSASVYHRPSVSKPINCIIGWYDVSNVFISSVASAWNNTPTANAWTRSPTVTAVAPANAYHAVVYGTMDIPSTGNTLFLDGFMLVEGSTMPAYVDGDQHAARWRGAPNASVSDLYDRSTRDDYILTSGGYGNMIVANGSLKQGSGPDIYPTFGNAPWHSARGHLYSDVMVISKVTITTAGADVRYAACPGLKKQDGDGRYLWATNEDPNLRIFYYNGASNIQLATVAHGLTLAVGSTIWVRVWTEGNRIFADIWNSPPTPRGTPAAAVETVLTEATTPKASEMGAARYGKVTPRAWPTNSGTRADIEEFRASPLTYEDRLLPDTFDLPQIPGDAPALVDVHVTHSGGAAAPAWALLGWWNEPSPYGRLWNGDFEVDTGGWAVGASDLFAAGTSITRVTGDARATGIAAAEVITPATISTGAWFRVYGKFRKGVTYTMKANIWAPGGSVTVMEGALGRNGDEATISPDVTLTANRQEVTATWVPTADRDYAAVGVRTTTATATTFRMDGVQMYEGTVPPAPENLGAVAPHGIIQGESASSLGTWAIVSDTNYRSAFGIRATASGVGSTGGEWLIDPSVIASEDFAKGEVDVEVWARMELGSGLVSPRMVLGAAPAAGITYGFQRFSNEWGAVGRALTKPSSGTAFREVLLGTVTLAVDPERPVRWKLTLQGSWAAGSSGSFGLDHMTLVPKTRRAISGPVGKVFDATYPRLFQSVNETTKILYADGSGATAKPNENPFPSVGMSRSLEMAPGPVEALLQLSSLVPDDPTADASTAQEDHTATVHFAVIPRVHLVRGS